MKIEPSLFIALKFLLGGKNNGKENRRYLLGAILGIAFSLIPLIVVMEVADGMIQGILGRVIELSTYDLQAMDTFPRNVSVHDDELALIKESPYVENAYLERSGSGILLKDGLRQGVAIRALNDNWFTDNAGVKKYLQVISGTPIFKDAYTCILGEVAAKKLNIIPGDKISLITTRSSSSGSIIPKMNFFTVTAVVSTGYQELDSFWCFIPYETGLKILSSENATEKIGIKLKPEYKFKYAEIAPIISQSIPFGYTVYTWYDLERTQVNSLETTKVLLLFIMWLIVLIAGANVSSAILMMVLERQKEIACLRSVGSSPFDIMQIFLFTGMIIGILGVVLGINLGIFLSININEILQFLEYLANNINSFFSFLSNTSQTSGKLLDPKYYLETIPITLDKTKLFFCAFFTIIISFLASIIPAWKAGRISPLEVLRKH